MWLLLYSLSVFWVAASTGSSLAQASVRTALALLGFGLVLAKVFVASEKGKRIGSVSHQLRFPLSIGVFAAS